MITPPESRDLGLKELSRQVTDNLLSLPGIILDEIVYTVQYCYTAQSLDGSRTIASDRVEKRYTRLPDLLEPDLEAAPLIIERLEEFLKKTREGSTIHEFAKKYLPHVRNFQEMLEEYTETLKPSP